jgi:hypothetical protein
MSDHRGKAYFSVALVEVRLWTQLRHWLPAHPLLKATLTRHCGAFRLINFSKVSKIDQRRQSRSSMVVPSSPPFGIYR